MNSTIYLLRTLRGAPLSVLICFYITRHLDIIYNLDFLSSCTGYSISTVRKACQLLVDLSLIYRSSRYGGYICNYSLDAEFLSFAILNTTSTTTIEGTHSNSEVVVEANVDSTYRSVNSTFRSVNPELRNLLFSYGVGEPMCSYLSRLNHMTSEYISAHFEFGLNRGDSIGLIIHRMRSGDPIPSISHDPIAAYRRSWLKS